MVIVIEGEGVFCMMILHHLMVMGGRTSFMVMGGRSSCLLAPRLAVATHNYLPRVSTCSTFPIAGIGTPPFRFLFTSSPSWRIAKQASAGQRVTHLAISRRQKAGAWTMLDARMARESALMVYYRFHPVPKAQPSETTPFQVETSTAHRQHHTNHAAPPHTTHLNAALPKGPTLRQP